MEKDVIYVVSKKDISKENLNGCKQSNKLHGRTREHAQPLKKRKPRSEEQFRKEKFLIRCSLFFFHVLNIVIFKTLFVRFIRHSEGAVTVVVVAIYIPRVYVELEIYRYTRSLS